MLFIRNFDTSHLAKCCHLSIVKKVVSQFKIETLMGYMFNNLSTLHVARIQIKTESSLQSISFLSMGNWPIHINPNIYHKHIRLERVLSTASLCHSGQRMIIVTQDRRQHPTRHGGSRVTHSINYRHVCTRSKWHMK